LRIISYNVNGIRAAIKKGLAQWVTACDPDVICLQETKIQPDQVDRSVFEDIGYPYQYYFSAEKKGYSSVAIISKVKPDKIVEGIGVDYIDKEGRNIRADFGDISVMSAYFPSGSNELRQSIKINYLDDFMPYALNLIKERPNLIIAGDYNICNKSIDIHNPVANKNSSGFLPEERQWMDDFISEGFVDSFRHVNKEAHNYTWWSYRMNARERNLGWRIDYQMVGEALKDKIKRAAILPQAKHSDHCPILVELDV
jgi:exodeoxyribonuclease-3